MECRFHVFRNNWPNNGRCTRFTYNIICPYITNATKKSFLKTEFSQENALKEYEIPFHSMKMYMTALGKMQNSSSIITIRCKLRLM
jgi:hypothetical protein